MRETELRKCYLPHTFLVRSLIPQGPPTAVLLASKICVSAPKICVLVPPFVKQEWWYLPRVSSWETYEITCMVTLPALTGYLWCASTAPGAGVTAVNQRDFQKSLSFHPITSMHVKQGKIQGIAIHTRHIRNTQDFADGNNLQHWESELFQVYSKARCRWGDEEGLSSHNPGHRVLC